MALRIRQLALVARDLEAVEAELCRALELQVCYRDPGVGLFGLHNGLMAIGDTFLEVVSPTQEGTTAGRLLDRRGGDGGYMVILETDNLEADLERFDAVGARVVWDVKLDDIAAAHLHPKDVGGAILSFDHPVPAGSWRWGGPDWETYADTKRVSKIIGAELQSEDPAAMAERWGEVLARPVRTLETGEPAIDLDDGQLRFVLATDGRGAGLAAAELRALPGTSCEPLTICGTRFLFTQG